MHFMEFPWQLDLSGGTDILVTRRIFLRQSIFFSFSPVCTPVFQASY